jgi:hypothetical protein
VGRPRNISDCVTIGKRLRSWTESEEIELLLLRAFPGILIGASIAAKFFQVSSLQMPDSTDSGQVVTLVRLFRSVLRNREDPNCMKAISYLAKEAKEGFRRRREVGVLTETEQ